MPTIYEVTELILLAQDGGGGDGAGGDGDAAPAGGGGFSNLFLMIGMIMVLYIFLMVLPQRREQKRMKEMMDSLKKNDRVIFGQGIFGTVVNVHQDGYVTLRIDDSTNAKMRVLRSSINRVLEDEDAEGSDKDKKDKKEKEEAGS